jgi:hypothetical protein
VGRTLIGPAGIAERIEQLTVKARVRADRLLDVRVEHGFTDPPAELLPWLEETFGSAAAVRHQTIVKVTNRVTLESAVIAPLRARRPMDGVGRADELTAVIAATEGDPFCRPLTGTPANAFGRVRGRRMITGANAALADRHHAVIVFDAHDPLSFDADLVADLFETGRAWCDLARRTDPTASHYTLLWNCLWRAGGSIVHGHAQATLGHGPPPARLERFRRDRAAYAARTGHEFVDDLVAVHTDLGLAVTRGGVATLAHVTPVKEREVIVVGGAGMDERDPAFSGAVAHALMSLRDTLGVRSFNLVLWRAPLERAKGWEGWRPMVRLVDRGDPFARPSDIGTMELYGTPIVGTDPAEVLAALVE